MKVGLAVVSPQAPSSANSSSGVHVVNATPSLPPSSSSSATSSSAEAAATTAATVATGRLSKASGEQPVVDVPLFWELARFWLRGDVSTRPPVGTTDSSRDAINTDEEFMRRILLYKDILMREQIHDTLAGMLGKRQRGSSLS